MKTLGIKNLLTILFVFFMISCKTIKQDVIKKNYFNHNYFVNDSLKIGIDFWGALEFDDLSKFKLATAKKIFKDHQEIPYKNIFLNCSSKVDKYNIYFFHDKLDYSESTKEQTKIIFYDSVNKISIGTKIKNKTKIICYVKTFENNNNYANIIVKDLLNRTIIDSVDKSKLNYFKILENYTKRYKNSLQAIYKINTAPIKEENENNSIKKQLLFTAHSFLSNNYKYDSIINIYEKGRKQYYNKTLDSLSLNSDVFKNQDVYNEIANIAAKNKVIILNEDHYYPKHRFFAMNLLNVLKQNGFQYLSIEDFVETENSKPIPNYDNGSYIIEPYFAHFIRNAKKLGFTILGHENNNKEIDREKGQALNIKGIIDKDVNAKIFVYVGHSHLEEEGSKKWMAQYFKELTNIDPITINQVAICAQTNDSLILLPKKYFVKDDKTKSTADYFLVNNLKPSLKSIYKNQEFKSIIIKIEKYSELKNKEVIIQVFDNDEYNLLKEQTIPILSKIEKIKTNKIVLSLPIGTYKIKIKTATNEMIYKKDLTVE